MPTVVDMTLNAPRIGNGLTSTKCSGFCHQFTSLEYNVLKIANTYD